MKINRIVPVIAGGSAMFLAGFVHAGVQATAYLEVSEFSIFVDADGTGTFDDNPLDYILISPNGNSRSSSSLAVYNGISSSDTDSTTNAFGPADAPFFCQGPDCGSIAIGNNDADLNDADTIVAPFGNLVHTDTLDFAIGDSEVSGSALDGAASGFTYADNGISGPTNTARADSVIENTVLTNFNFDVVSDIDVTFSFIYDMLVDSKISDDIAADNTLGGIANASASFTVTLVAAGSGATIDGGTASFSDGITFTDNASDALGFNDSNVFVADDEFFQGDVVSLTEGNYQLFISHKSDVNTELVPEPGSLALFGLGLLGLGYRIRQQKKG